MWIAVLLFAFAQDPAPRAAPNEAVQRILDEALGQSQAWSNLAELVQVAPHRLAGSAGAARAVDWAEAKLRRLGFENVRREPCKVPHWERGAVARLSVIRPAAAAGTKLSILALGGSVGTPGGPLRASVVGVKSFEELAALGAGARGKLILFQRPMDPAERDPFAAYVKAVDQRGRGANEAAKAGGVGALVRSMTLATDDFPHTGSMSYAEGLTQVPAVALSTVATDRVAGWLAAGETVELELELDCRTLGEADSFNVIGELVGREEPGEIVLVGAHLDAWDVGQGAHDDGAGCVQAIEALRILKALELRPRRTLRCVLFMNEENGLAGARAYAAAHAVELERHVLALESDRGGFAPRGFDTNATESGRSRLSELARELLPIGAERVEAGYGGADISVLAEAGVPLVGFVPDPSRYFDFHHCERDRLEAVHPRELAAGAGAIAALVWMVAELDQPLERAPPAR